MNRTGRYDIQLSGGGGGGGGARAASEAPGGSGGIAAEFVPVQPAVTLERDYYLIDVGSGGAGGRGGWNWRAAPALSDGQPGTDSAIFRCSSSARIAFARGGSAGHGDAATTGNRNGNPGETFVNPETHQTIGDGGGGGHSGDERTQAGDGGDARGHGAGGGGQGATRRQWRAGEPWPHGGNGSGGFVRLTKVG